MRKNEWHPPEMRDWWDHLVWHIGGSYPPSKTGVFTASLKWVLLGIGIIVGAIVYDAAGLTWTVLSGIGVIIGAVLFLAWRSPPDSN